MVLNGWHDPSFFLAYPEYRFLGIQKFEDGDELCPEIAGRRLFRVTHSLDTQTLAGYASAIPPEFDVKLFATPEECLAFVRENSGLAEETPGTFLISPAFQIPGMEYPARYLSI